MPADIRYTDSLGNLKILLEGGSLINDCPCRICKNYVRNVGFLEILE